MHVDIEINQWVNKRELHWTDLMPHVKKDHIYISPF